MPCQSQLLRLRDSRQTLHHIFRHAVTYSPQQFRHEHSGTEEAARVEAARQRARLEALKRLDKHINPNDLSATLEAHRDANRASVIRKISSERSDPDVLRPSFLESQPHARAKRKLKQSANEVEEDEEDKSALGAFSKVVTNAAGNIDNAAAYQLRSLKRAAEATEREAQNEWRRTQNKEQYQRWVDFLTKYEDPLEPIPDYSDDDRRVFFTTLRRAFAIIREEQLKRSATWFVEDLAPKGFLSYYGLAQPIVSGLKGYPRSEPWNRRPKAGVKGDLMRYWLNVEIRAFANWMEMTPSENLARAKLSKILIDSIQQANPVLVAETYGSQATGLTMPNSDIDIRIKDSTFKHVPYEGEPNDKAAKAVWAAENMAQRKRLMNSHLRRIQSLLSSHDDFYQAHINETAYFPLVTAVHIPTGLKVQIVSTKWDHGARAATEKYLAEFPNLKMVFLLLKATLNLRNLSDPWFGGVGSYTLFMMCVAALKHGNKGLASKMESPALCLLHTLDFWGKFDTHREGLSVEPFAKFRKVRRQGWNEIEARKKDPSRWARHRIAVPSAYKPWMLHLQDPADLYNDLGRSAIAIKDIQATFKQLHYDLTSELEDPKRREDATPLLKNFVGNSEKYFDEMRIPVDLWGSQFVEEEEAELEQKGEGEDVVDVEAASKDASEEVSQVDEASDDAVATLRHTCDRAGSE